MLATVRRGISQEYIGRTLLRSLTAHHQRSLSAEDAIDQSRAVLGWIQQVHRSRRKALQTVRSYVKDEVPLAYLLGTQPFCNMDLKVRPPILIPRPETEEWTIALADVLKQRIIKRDSPFKILDLCAGSGCIGLALADQLKNATSVQVLGVDINSEAIALAQENAQAHQLEEVCKYKQGDLFDDTWLRSFLEREEYFDIVVGNPPYISRAEYEVLDKSVKDYEDRKALLGEAPAHAQQYNKKDGLAFYRRIRELLDRLSRAGPSRDRDVPLLVLEVGKDQAADVVAMFRDDGLHCRIMRDFSGIERSVWVYQSQ